MKVSCALKAIPAALLIAASLWMFNAQQALSDPIEMDDVAAEQAKEKLELEDMRKELKGVKGEVNSAIDSMAQLTNMLNQRAANPVREYHLFARESFVDVGGGLKLKALTYNGNIPGPQIDVMEGQPIRIILHNQMKVPTSLHFHGLIVPQNVDGLPRSKTGPVAGQSSASTNKTAGGGLFPATTGGASLIPLPERFVKPGESYGFQFIPQGAGTYYYHPQIIHMDQRLRGMYGALIVHPRTSKRADCDQVLFIGELKNENERLYTVNGKTAPHIPPIEVRGGERVRLRLVNVCDEAVPMHLSGHKMEIVSNNGSDLLEPQVFRDTVTLNPGERMDVEFTAGNIGVWSLASEKVSQTTSGGKFPAGIALFVRYQEMKGNSQ